jgi:GNAT superfamily N-acetyltransferase
LPERQLFLLDCEGVAVGTATAWFNNDYRGEKCGRIHWVAIVPEHQGRGLSKPLLSAACRRLEELGHHKAYLVTSSVRIPAISLYLRFGFAPDVRSDEDKKVWNEIMEHVNE